MGKLNYAEKREQRIERLEALAEKNKRASNQAYESSKQAVGHIPLGQPILVGHHSEKKHRNALNKSWDKMGKSVALQNKSDYYTDKAAAAKANKSISSDDPEAIQKLKTKLKSLTDLQENMKAINKICKSKKWSNEEIAQKLKSDFNLDEESITTLLNPPYSYQSKGFQQYTLSNNNATIRRIKQRIETLENLAKLETETLKIGAVEIVTNTEDNRIELYFPAKPATNFRKELKRYGFRWSPLKSAWQKHISQWNLNDAKSLAEKYNTL